MLISINQADTSPGQGTLCYQNCLWEEAPETITLWTKGWRPVGTHSLTGSNEDPMDPEECTPAVSPDMAQGFTFCPSPPGLYP